MTSSSAPLSKWSVLWRGLVGVVGVLLVLELVLRIWITSPSTTEPDPEFEYFQRPHSRQVFSSEGYSRSTTNRLGMNDDDPWEPKPPLRALLIGDSYAEAKQVDPSQNFAAVAERAVEGLELCNAGRSGWGPADLAAFAERRAHLFEPDLLVIQINDTDLEEFHRSNKIHLRRNDGGYELVLPPPAPAAGPAQRIWRKLKHSSALFTQVTRRLEGLHQMETARLARHFSPAPASSSPTPQDGPIPDDSMEMLVFLHETIREHYEDIVYLYIPRIRYDDTLDGRLRNPDRRELYRAFAQRVDTPLVDPTEALLERYRATRQPQHGFHNSKMGKGHANVRGHEVIGAILAAELETHLP